VYFSTIDSASGELIKVSKDIIKVENYVEFSFTSSNVLISTDYIVSETNSVINFTSNMFQIGMLFPKKDVLLYLLCAFQYVDSIISLTRATFPYSLQIIQVIGYFLKDTASHIVTG